MWRVPTLSQSSRADADLLPQTAATGVDVVGRRAPIGATSDPTRTLKRLDLPLPVAPASATTVCPPIFEVRAVAFMRTASALRTAPAGRHPSPDSRADISSAALAWTVSADAELAEARLREADRAPIFCLLTAQPPMLSRRR